MRVEEQLRAANRTLRTINRCNEALVRATEEIELAQAICRILVEDGGMRMAWVGYREENAARTIRRIARAGFDDGYLDSIDVGWGDTPTGRGPMGVAIRTCEVCWRALSRQISIGDFRHRIRPGALVIREQKQWRSSPPWSASRQYRIYSDNASADDARLVEMDVGFDEASADELAVCVMFGRVADKARLDSGDQAALNSDLRQLKSAADAHCEWRNRWPCGRSSLFPVAPLDLDV